MDKETTMKVVQVSLVEDPPGCELKNPKPCQVSPKTFKARKSKEFYEGCLFSAQYMAKKLSENGNNVHPCECLEMGEFILKCIIGFGDAVLNDPQFPYKNYLPPAKIIAVTDIILNSKSHFLNCPGIDKRKFELEWRKVRSAMKNWEMEF